MIKQQKMICVALRHLSPIQKGIQGCHAIVDFGQKFANLPAFKKWARKDKTLILLEAHTDGQLNEALQQLITLKVPAMYFAEPDAGNVTTAICFLVEERVGKRPTVYTDTEIKVRTIKNRFNFAI